MNRSTNSHFNPWLALVVVCFGQFMVVLDATIVNVALPAIQSDLGFSDSSLPWVVYLQVNQNMPEAWSIN